MPHGDVRLSDAKRTLGAGRPFRHGGSANALERRTIFDRYLGCGNSDLGPVAPKVSTEGMATASSRSEAARYFSLLRILLHRMS